MPKLSLEIEVKDKASKEFVKLEKQLGKYGVKLKEIDKNNQKLNKSFATQAKSMAVYAAAVYAAGKSMDAVIGNGLRFNSLMEDQRNGIRALVVATSANVDAMGNAIDINEKYAKANIVASDTLKRLQDINAETPHTLGQTSMIFKAMFANAKNAGASMDDMVGITKLVSKASGAAGIEFQQLLASVDGLANGTFLANSEMGRFLSSIGLTPQALKDLAKEGKSIDFIKTKLADFNFKTDSMSEATSNLANAWDQLTGEMTTDLFNDMKQSSKDLTTFLEENKEGLIAFGQVLTSVISTVAQGAIQITDNIATIIDYALANSIIYQTFLADEPKGEKLKNVRQSIKDVNDDLVDLKKREKETLDQFNNASGNRRREQRLQSNLLVILKEQQTAQQDKNDLQKVLNDLLAEQNKLINEAKLVDKDKVIEWTYKTKNDGSAHDIQVNSFASENADKNRIARRKRLRIKEEEDIAKVKADLENFDTGLTDILETQLANSLTSAIQDGIDGDFNFATFAESFADAIGSSFISSGITEMISKQMALSSMSGLGAIGAGVGLLAIGGLFGGSDTTTPEKTFAEKMAEELSASSKALEKTVSILSASGQEGTAISTSVEGQLSQISSLESTLKSLEDSLKKAEYELANTDLNYLEDTEQNLLNAEINNLNNSISTLEQNISTLSEAVTQDVLTFANQLTSSFDIFGNLSDSLSGTTDYQDAILARAKAQLPLTAQSEAGFKSYVGALSLQGIELNNLLATIESTTVGTTDYDKALSDLINVLDLSDDATLEHALNVVESIDLVGQSFSDIADAAKDAANSIGDIIDAQQAFLDTNRSLVETSGESVTRLQDRFTEEVNEANLAQILLSEARATGTQASIAEAIANLNEQENDVLSLGQQVIDSASTAYGSTSTAQDIVNAVLSEVEARESSLLSVQESLQVEANEISLSILEQLQILNATVVTTNDIFNTEVVA